MADHAVEGDDGEIFIYRGGRRAPWNVAHARIDKSIDEIEDNAFRGCVHLVQVETHDGIRKIGVDAFWGCKSLRRISLKSAVEISAGAFFGCESLEYVEFSDYLEIIGHSVFAGCALKHLKLPTIIAIGLGAFCNCKCLTDIESVSYTHLTLPTTPYV